MTLEKCNSLLSEEIIIRKATMDDLDDIQSVYEKAREFMRANGNRTQWSDKDPKIELVINDINHGDFYVITKDGVIGGVFSYLLGDDPFYYVIEDGDWHFHEPYDVIHRVASNGTIRGITKLCFDFCTEKSPHVRMDTHRDNIPMQNALTRYGFRPCGIVHVANGTERIAYDFKRGE